MSLASALSWISFFLCIVHLNLKTSAALISCVVASVNFQFRRDSSISSGRTSISENFVLSSSRLVACSSFSICLILS